MIVMIEIIPNTVLYLNAINADAINIQGKGPLREKGSLGLIKYPKPIKIKGSKMVSANLIDKNEEPVNNFL